MYARRPHGPNHDLLRWCKTLSLAVLALYVLYATSQALHVYTHALRRNKKLVAGELEFVNTFCANDTLVHLTRRVDMCERSREVVSRDPTHEAIFETLASLHICSTAGDPHRSDGGMHAGDVHCPHAYYVVVGVAVTLVSVFVALCCCRPSPRAAAR